MTKDICHIVKSKLQKEQGNKNYALRNVHCKMHIHRGKKISDRLPYLPYKMTTFRTIKILVKNDAKLTIFAESIKI